MVGLQGGDVGLAEGVGERDVGGEGAGGGGVGGAWGDGGGWVRGGGGRDMCAWMGDGEERGEEGIEEKDGRETEGESEKCAGWMRIYSLGEGWCFAIGHLLC